jgi:hypothetical protein
MRSCGTDLEASPDWFGGFRSFENRMLDAVRLSQQRPLVWSRRTLPGGSQHSGFDKCDDSGGRGTAGDHCALLFSLVQVRSPSDMSG